MGVVAMSNNSNFWIDLTDMLVWRGHFTGIQRVVYEYATRFAKEPNTKFCAYDELDNRFFEVSADVLDTKHRTVSPVENVEASITARRRARQIIGKPYYSLSEERRRKLQPTVQYANYLARSVMHRLLPKPEQPKPKSIYASYKDAHFKRGDTLVLLGAGWNETKLFDAVVSAKQQHGIRISQHINDILPIYQPQLFADELIEVFTPFVNKAIRHADVITVISEATKRDLLVFCKENGVKNARIKVIRLGDDVVKKSSTKPKEIHDAEQFILAVGTFEIRKNYTLLYQTMKLAQLEGRPLPKIVIVGRKGWLSSDLAHVIERDPQAKQHILWLTDVNDEGLEWLYNNCLFTVFPSLSEGWGLPIAESLQHGKLCIASGVSSMLEIGDGMVDYFLPYDARECLEKIVYYLAEDRYLEENHKINNTYQVYTWDESYQSLKSALKNQ